MLRASHRQLRVVSLQSAKKQAQLTSNLTASRRAGQPNLSPQA
ncbi:hypothetical protein CAMRE0001_0405 [Campylobacter rectus RM3267]|uniref:Uncharacterized protein n=1 Tax=Campylobacter rectus RM3267 TaxID=553218 RepID=B9D2H2_CAMRE|nr:hypothetical protein CAMRE0001_0405 [Campylobacter rectus RM3267]